MVEQRNGALRAQVFVLISGQKAEMVHCMYQSSGLCRLEQWKWCTECTIILHSLHDLRANGASGAPFPAVSITNSRRMVHQVHHVGRFRWSPNQNGRVCSSSGCPALRGPTSETSIPAKISTAPTVSRGLSTSPSMSHPKNAANTGSAEYMSAA